MNLELGMVRRGDVIVIPGYRGTYNGLTVARIRPARYRGYLHVSFVGGRDYGLDRTTIVLVKYLAQTKAA